MKKEKTQQPASEAPPKHLSTTVAGEGRELFMSMGLLSEMARVIGTLEDLQLVILDVDRTNDLVNLCIAVRDERGRVDLSKTPDVNFGDVLEPDEYQRILDWALKHAIGFFIKRAKALSSASTHLAPELQALAKQSNGFAASISGQQ